MKISLCELEGNANRTLTSLPAVFRSKKTEPASPRLSKNILLLRTCQLTKKRIIDGKLRDCDFTVIATKMSEYHLYHFYIIYSFNKNDIISYHFFERGTSFNNTGICDRTRTNENPIITTIKSNLRFTETKALFNVNWTDALRHNPGNLLILPVRLGTVNLPLIKYLLARSLLYSFQLHCCTTSIQSPLSLRPLLPSTFLTSLPHHAAQEDADMRA